MNKVSVIDGKKWLSRSNGGGHCVNVTANSSTAEVGEIRSDVDSAPAHRIKMNRILAFRR